MGRPSKDRDVFHDPEGGPAPLTRAERKFIKAYLDCGDVAKAAIEAGLYKSKGGKYARIEAAKKGSAILRKAGPAIAELMDHEELSDVQLMQRLKAGLDATHAVVVRIDKAEHIEDYPDFRARYKFTEMAFKLRNAFPYRPAVVHQGAADPAAGSTIPEQHLEAIDKMTAEEKERKLEEMILARKRGPVRLVK
jgi:hypothetical protein